MRSQSTVKLKSYLRTIYSLQSTQKGNYFVSIRNVTLYSLSSILLLNLRADNSQGILPCEAFSFHSYRTFVRYVELWQVFFLLKRIHPVLSSPKWIHTLLSADHSYTFANSFLKTFLISATSLCLKKNTSVVSIKVCMNIWKGLWNIIYI